MNSSAGRSSKNRGQNAYQAILAAIREGIYCPGEPLREEEVAARIGVSRTPVREALGRLQEKGLLEQAPGRGLAVTILTMPQIFELYAMREELEGIAARFAAHHATQAEIANLRRINNEFAEVGDTALAASLNRQFHARLYDAARNRYLRQALEDLQETIALLPDTTFIHPGRKEIAAKEHEKLVEAIDKHQPNEAENGAIEHIRESLKIRLLITSSGAG